MKIKDKTVVITGGGRGIGVAIAQSFAEQGANIIINYHRDSVSAENTRSELAKMGCQATTIKADIRIRKDVEQLLKKTLDCYGQVDILINNASVTERANLNSITDSQWNSVIDTNLKGTFLCSQIFGTKLQEQGSGSIINISSTAAIRPFPISHHYVASKSGITGLTKALALTFAPTINVNAIAPGYVETDTRVSLSEEERNKMMNRIPLQRFATPQEVASLVVFLATEGKYITGQTIIIDGGLSINMPF